MNRALRPPVLIFLAGFVLVSTVLAASLIARPAGAHGSTQSPASRVYTCRFENPNNPMCASAWSSNSQALYDWMEVNIGDAAGRHQQLIPDGQLCSAGRSKYAAFNQPGDWPVTALRTDGSGAVNLVYENTAPHSTEYYRVYITRSGFDARTDTLGWGDLELAYDSGPLERAARQTMRASLPNRDVPAILYIVWQRSDSPEAFYACSDVTVNGGSPSPTPSPTTAPTTSMPSTSQPTTSAPGTSAPSTSTPSNSTPATPPTTAPGTTTAPSTNPPLPTTPPPTAAPTTATPATAAPTTTLASSEATTPGSDQTSVVPSKNVDSVASAPPSSTRTESSATKAADEDDSAIAGATDRSTGPSSPASTSGEAREPVDPFVSAQDGSNDVAETDLAVSASVDDSDQAFQSAVATETGNPGGRTPLLVGLIGLGTGGLVLLGLSLRRSDMLDRIVGLLGIRQVARSGSGDKASGAGLRTSYYDVRHARGQS